MIKVIDNIVTKKEQKKIKSILLGRDLPWYYLDDVSLKDNPDEQKPGLSHYFIHNTNQSDHFKYIQNLIINTFKKIKLKEVAIIQSRGFLQLPLSNNLLKGKYVDSPHIDMFEKHLVFLYYVNDSDGDTVIYKDKNLKIKKRVKPKQGRMLVFNGEYWHSGSQPTTGVRCVINTNIRI
tara:strand:- start:293 stop:826 length:534 start_codon:yes stop_codon:yes gene_type:complete